MTSDLHKSLTTNNEFVNAFHRIHSECFDTDCMVGVKQRNDAVDLVEDRGDSSVVVAYAVISSIFLLILFNVINCCAYENWCKSWYGPDTTRWVDN